MARKGQRGRRSGDGRKRRQPRARRQAAANSIGAVYGAEASRQGKAAIRRAGRAGGHRPLTHINGGGRAVSAHVAPVATDAAAGHYARQRVRDHAGPANGAPGIAPTCDRPGKVASAATNERRRREGRSALRSRGRRSGERHGGN